MPTTIALSCTCGTVRGTAAEVSPTTGTHVVCMCDDCQTYAHFLGRADAILDAHGGTEIFQLTPAQLTLTEGLEQVRCVRLSPKGVMRWYAGCCNTPIANTADKPKMPFAGVPVIFMGGSTEPLGPIRAKIHGRYCPGPMPTDAHAKWPVALLLRTARLLLVAWLRGRHAPSPFFDAKTKEPVVAPQVLTIEERQQHRPQHVQT